MPAKPSKRPLPPQLNTSSPHIHHLRSMHTHLHLLHHRNKNQHRLSKWWKSFSMFRKQVPKLIDEVEKYEAARAVKEGSKFTIAAKENLKLRIEFLGRLRGAWFLAFSSVVADTQFSTLGLMLVGSLARFWSLVRKIGEQIGVDFDVEEEDVGAVNKVKSAGLGFKAERPAKNGDFGELVVRDSEVGDELGVKIERTSVVKLVDEEESGGDAVASVKDEKSSKEKKRRKEGLQENSKKEVKAEERPKKKKKKGDAFDDLFGSLT